MDQGQLFRGVFLLVGAAVAGGVLAHYLRLPVIVGYLAAGVVIGPLAPGDFGDPDRLELVAEFGVALLMFALGVQFSLRELAHVRGLAVLGGSAQILLTLALGLPVGLALGLDGGEAVYLGALMALSSTMVALKLLESRGELATVHGRAAVGLLIVQDVAVVPLMILLPAATGAGGVSAAEVGEAAGKAALLLSAAYVLGTRLVPWLLFRVASTNSRELFVLAIVALAVGFSVGSHFLGLSVAFGAFLAGLIVSGSEFSYRTLAEILPLRDVFATIFFIAMGMLIDPGFILEHADQVAIIAAALLVGKLLITLFVVQAAGLRGRTSVMTAGVLAQTGEFSFILARVGMDKNVIDADLNSTFLGAAMVSIVLNPALLRLAPMLLRVLQIIPGIGPLLAEPVGTYVGDQTEALRHHVVICGYGDAGRELAQAVLRRGFRCLVVDLNPYVIRDLRRRQVPCVYGDASRPEVLQQCGLENAQVLAITVPELAAAQLTVVNARAINPHLDIIARGRGPESHAVLKEVGAAEVIHPEFEGGLEFVRHTLRSYGVDSTQIASTLARRRIDYYER
jgi:CPA2 family monovalent cation:H+ antiporter-2